MKKLLSVLSIILVVSAIIVGGCEAPASTPAPTPAPAPAPTSQPTAEPIELSLALMVPPTHTRWIGTVEPWLKSIEEGTEGKVKVVPYFAEALAKSSEIYNATATGVADLGELVTYHAAGQFPYSDFFLLPGLSIPDSVMGSRLHWHLAQTIPEFGAQYKDTKLLAAYVQTGKMYSVMSVDPVRTLDDVKGKKLWVGGPVGTAIGEAIGATPVSMSMADVYMAVEKGVLDGVVSGWSLLASRKFGEIMKNVAYGPGFGGTPFIFFMNLDTWNGLPSDVQKVFDNLGGEAAAVYLGERLDQEMYDTRKIAEEQYNCEFYELPSSELANWVEHLNVVKDDWLASMNEKGLSGQKVIDEYLRFVQSTK